MGDLDEVEATTRQRFIAGDPLGSRSGVGCVFWPDSLWPIADRTEHRGGRLCYANSPVAIHRAAADDANERDLSHGA